MGETNLHTHLSEDALELYSLGRLEEPELDVFEQHLLLCATCQDRLTETENYLVTVKEATARLERELSEKTAKANTSGNWLSGWAKPVWATGAAVAAALIMMPLFSPTVSNPVAVELTAVRGSEDGRAAAGTPLELKLQTSGVDLTGAAFVELVDAGGAQKWQGKPERKNGSVVARIESGFPAGRYWVRLYSDANRAELLHEYALVLK